MKWFSSLSRIGKFIVAGVVLLFLCVLIGLLSPNESQPDSAIVTNTPNESQPDFAIVTSFTGNQVGKSEEFTITSNEIKFTYQCDEGLFVCVGWLYQVGGSKQELFRSPGNTGTLSDQKILSIGPGLFYIEVDTADRAYTIDVFRGGTSVSPEELSTAQAKIAEAEKYRNVSGFTLTDENMISGTLFYSYQTDDGVYSVRLQVDQKVTDFELESQYNVAKGNLNIDGVDVQYAFSEDSINSVEFTFVADDKTHVGFANRIDNAVDQPGIELTMKTFLSLLVQTILAE